MKFKVDENLPVEVVKLLEDNGHDAVTVLEQNLGGEPDSHIAEICQKEKRALVTLDTDFSDIRTYSPDEFFGLIILHLKRQDKPHVLSVVIRLINILLKEPVKQRLWIVEEGRIRISGGDDDSKNPKNTDLGAFCGLQVPIFIAPENSKNAVFGLFRQSR